jgi:P-type Ca2+ transporter type 2B
MGGANNICSDKTGTLTQNLMEVKYFWAMGKRLERADINKDTFTYDLKDAIGIG